MADVTDLRPDDDGLDEDLVARFAVLDDVEAPDLWVDVAARPARRTHRTRWLAAAAAVFLAGVGVVAVAARGGGEDEAVTADSTALAVSDGPVLRPIEDEIIGWLPNEARVLPDVVEPGDEVRVVFDSRTPGCFVGVPGTPASTGVVLSGCDDSLSGGSITYTVSVDTPPGEYQVCAADETGATNGGCGRILVVDDDPVGPTVWHHPVDDGSGLDAVVTGEMTYDAEHDCFLLGGLPVVWPAGTEAASPTGTVRLADGRLVTPGDTVSGGGGYLDLVEQYGIPAACVGPTREVATFNSGEVLTVTTD